MPTIPSHWRTQRLKTVVYEKNVKGFPDEPLLAATQARGVILKTEFETRTVEAQKSLETLKLVDVNDFVISLRSFQGGIERSHARGIISPAYTVLQTQNAGNREYLALLFKSRQFIDALTLTVTGIREGQNIEYPRLARELVALPPAAEQAAIVKYLAHAQARVDKAINAKRKLIALIEERKQVIIDQAVTRGLAASTQFKDSEVAWLGEVPTHWKIRRIKYLLRPINKRSIAGDEQRLTVSSAKGIVPRADASVTMFEAATYVGHKLCWPDDLVINSLWAWGRGLGVSRHHGLVSAAYGVYRSRVGTGLVPAYLHEVVRSRPFHKELFVQSRGVWKSRLQLTDERFLALYMPLPPLSEQIQIVEYLRGKSTESDNAVAKIAREIELLREFRTRLTSDVVTGQVDVREIAATLFELNDDVPLGTGDELIDPEPELEEPGD
ncbi:restriction endonuclease subunit S [Salinibacterium amurskyense]|nr:restriction endonuclease subunit S [Salinibacterium amurskyense]